MRRILILLLSAAFAFAQAETKPTAPLSIPDLQKRIEEILKKYDTPGAGVAIVKRDGPVWVAGIGLADVATKKPVTADTLFRIGSTSKTFVALSVLKLQEEGRLSFQDTLKSHAPDLEYSNPWEATDPLRLVHLLEHTSGWDDMALCEYAINRMPEISLREGFAIHPQGRTSRWKPGTRYSYSNSGPAVAAYVLEKVTGQRFEDYVEQNWFKPLGMKTASFFDTPEVQSRIATLYSDDGIKVIPYWHIMTRPSGAINASPTDMAKYLQFYLNRGSVDGVQLLPVSALDRMEKPTTTYAARQGLGHGYGLHNYTTNQDAWVYHGHNGAIPGALTEFSYLPLEGFGYVVMINSGDGAVIDEISAAIRSYLTAGLKKPAIPAAIEVPAALAQAYAGWYEPVNPRSQSSYFISRIADLKRAHFEGNALRLIPLNLQNENYFYLGNYFFRISRDSVPTLALITDTSEGKFIEVGMGSTYRRIPGWVAVTEVLLVLLMPVLMLTTLVFALVWGSRKALGRMRGVPHLSVRILPLLATLSLLACIAVVLGAAMDSVYGLGLVSAWTMSLFILTIVFPICAFGGLLQALRHRNAGINRLAWWHSLATSLVLSIVAVYLIYWGMFGYRSWV